MQYAEIQNHSSYRQVLQLRKSQDYQRRKLIVMSITNQSVIFVRLMTPEDISSCFYSKLSPLRKIWQFMTSTGTREKYETQWSNINPYRSSSESFNMMCFSNVIQKYNKFTDEALNWHSYLLPFNFHCYDSKNYKLRVFHYKFL